MNLVARLYIVLVEDRNIKANTPSDERENLGYVSTVDTIRADRYNTSILSSYMYLYKLKVICFEMSFSDAMRQCG